jgi:hypothetical protein
VYGDPEFRDGPIDPETGIATKLWYTKYTKTITTYIFEEPIFVFQPYVLISTNNSYLMFPERTPESFGTTPVYNTWYKHNTNCEDWIKNKQNESWCMFLLKGELSTNSIIYSISTYKYSNAYANKVYQNYEFKLSDGEYKFISNDSNKLTVYVDGEP